MHFFPEFSKNFIGFSMSNKRLFDLSVVLLIGRQYIVRYNRRKIIVVPSMEAKLFKKSRIAFRTNSKIALLRFAVQSNEHSSNSFVLSLAQFLNTLKALTPPGFVPLLKKKSSSYAKVAQSEPSYFEPWCDYLFTLVCEGCVAKNCDELIVVAKIDDQTFKLVETLAIFEIKANAFSAQKKLATLEAINLLSDSKELNRHEIKNRIAIINFSTSTLNQDKLKPRINIEGLLTGIFYNPGDSWRSYRILKNEIPTADELAKFNTVVLSGSSYSVNSMAPQMQQLQGILLEALNINKKLKVLGICFGHQFLAKSSNIEVVTKQLSKGLQNVNFEFDEHSETEYLNDFIKSQLRYLRLYKYHNDHVTSSPDLFNKFGSSAKCSIESLISKDKRILSFQFHPQYTEEYIHSFEERLTKYFKPEYQILTHKLRDDFHHKSIEIMRKTMRNFLNWKVES